ncbi:MAG: hypothetical protein ACTHOU_21030 [Aureliella sp.]
MSGADTQRLWQRRGHQEDKLAVGGIVAVGIGFFAIVLVALLIITLVVRVVVAPRPLVNVEAEWKQTESAPGVRPNQAAERERDEQAWKRRLNSYGWQDEEHATAHIPIDRAIEIMSEGKMATSWSQPAESVQAEGRTKRRDSGGASRGDSDDSGDSDGSGGSSR